MSEMSRPKIQNSESGQAVVEYILLLAISVALIIGLMKQLYQPFGNWMQDYMGQYLECLLDVGELPSLGGGSDSGECNSKFSSFSVTAGRPPLEPNPKDKGKNGNNLQGRNKTDANDSSSRNSFDQSGEQNNVAARARRSGRDPSFSVGTPTGSDSKNLGDNSGDNLQNTTKLPESSYLKLRKNEASTKLNQELENRGSLSQSFFVKAKNKKEVEAPVLGKTNLDEDGGAANKTKKLIIKAPERKIAADEKQESWNFSDYIKYAIIILILVALGLFLFGQMASISKSMEKN